MDLNCYEHDQGFVIDRFKQGEFDYIDAANEVVETDFFRFIGAKGYLEQLAKTYPSPRKKEEVPTWLYISSNISMRLHGVHSFHAYPYVVRCGGMLNAFGPQVARKTTHPDSGDVTLVCNGFNQKNDYDRQTPCDQDYLRKFSKDTDPEKLIAWFNGEVVRLFKRHKLFDKNGIWIGDGSYVFVPDNPAYEKSVRLLFDEHGHPVDSAKLAKMSPQAAARCRWRRCYKLVSLLYVDPSRNFFLRVAMRLVPGNEHECPILYEMVDQFVEQVGENVIRRLLLDRGFIDGEKIAHCKRKHGIDILIPVRKDMDIYEDVLGLLKLNETKFEEYRAPKRDPVDAPRLPHSPESVRKRELKRQQTVKDKTAAQTTPLPPEKVLVRSEVAGISGLRSFTGCSVPLDVIVNREIYADGHATIWILLDTKPLTSSDGPAQRRSEYAVRTEIEEGHRQLKCFWDMARFTSRAFSMVLNQIVFVVLAYNLFQIFMRAETTPPLSRRTRSREIDLLFSTAAVIIIYTDNRFATFTPMAYSEFLLTLSEEARSKALARIHRLRAELDGALSLSRPP
jgi:hypothetical protein